MPQVMPKMWLQPVKRRPSCVSGRWPRRQAIRTRSGRGQTRRRKADCRGRRTAARHGGRSPCRRPGPPCRRTCRASRRGRLRAVLARERDRIRVQMGGRWVMTCLPVHSWRGLSTAGAGSNLIFSPAELNLSQLQQLHHHAALEGVAFGQVDPHDVILDEASERLAVGRDDVLLVRRGDLYASARAAASGTCARSSRRHRSRHCTCCSWRSACG